MNKLKTAAAVGKNLLAVLMPGAASGLRIIGGQRIDEYISHFGIRTLSFDAYQRYG